MQLSSDPNLLKFDVLARVAELPGGALDQDKLKGLIRLLRPDRDGETLLVSLIASMSKCSMFDSQSCSVRQLVIARIYQKCR
jgi:hypothetical protein